MKRRDDDAGSVRIEVEDDSEDEGAQAPAAERRSSGAAWLAVGVLASLTAAAAFYRWLRSPSEEEEAAAEQQQDKQHEAERDRRAAQRRRRQRLLYAAGAVVVLLGASYVVWGGGQIEHAGQVLRRPLSAALVKQRLDWQRQAEQHLEPARAPAKQILFGDLHVHTTFSTDAFLLSIPLVGGEGAHPPADACDFARYCSALDFFALTDHAEALTPRHWRESKESVRQCNAVAPDPKNPDLVAFIGWEWTQVGATPETHYGHKNVIYEAQADDQLPVRPIAAKGFTSRAMQARDMPLSLYYDLATVPLRDFGGRQRYKDLVTHLREVAGTPACPEGVNTRELPLDCREYTATPRGLFDKLTEWGFDTIVIPHGTTWGFYTPPGNTYAKQISASQDDADKQRIIEVYSGHGSSEEYRDWRAARRGPDGELICPEPTADYEPCCWRAGEIIRARCGSLPAAECEARVKEARQRHLALGAAGFRAIPGATVEDWRNCGQCQDCYIPTFNYRPGGSVQYVLAKGSFDDPDRPRHVRLGFVASSDVHKGRPGTGYKEYARRKMTEANSGPIEERFRDLMYGPPQEAEPRALDLTINEMVAFRAINAERQASFFMTGGLAAVHSEGRSRRSIWQAMKRREVYGTSGERILLWFDLVNAGPEPVPMGGEVRLAAQAPRFVVRAVGSFVQQPGCPAHVIQTLPPDRLSKLCAGECYYPSDQRHLITRIEVIRIRPQRHPDEPIAPLIQDVWRTFPCPADPAGCQVEFDDPGFVSGGRDVIYYVRAIQEPTDAVNAGHLRCQDAECKKLAPCYGDYRTPLDDDCLGKNEERAWSSPIWVRSGPAPAGAAK